ncbi:MAG TPA: hypothetical protein VEW04_06890, partial [Allosphingosinicella sp.]|nr:hypothetical protein [Allosphingosinicella sp.]
MIILTGATGTPARSAQLAKAAATSAEPKLWSAKPADGNFLLDGREFAHLTAEEGRALSQTVKKTVSAVSPEAKGAVKALEMWLSTQKCIAAFQAREGSWFAVVDAGIDAAGDLAAVLELILPAIAENRVFRIVDNSLT